MSDIVRHIWFFVCMSIWSNIRLNLSICALERLSNEETHCKLANFAILKFSLIKLFIHKQLTVDKLWISATFVCIALHTSIQLNIWSEWLGNMTWLIKRQQQRQRQWQIYFENTSKEWSLLLLTIEAFDQSDEKTRPDQQKDNNKDKYNDKYILRTPQKSEKIQARSHHRVLPRWSLGRPWRGF